MRRRGKERGRAKGNDGRVAFFRHLKLRGKELRQAMKETEPAENLEEMKKHLWNLYSLTDGEIGEKPPEKIMEEWR